MTTTQYDYLGQANVTIKNLEAVNADLLAACEELLRVHELVMAGAVPTNGKRGEACEMARAAIAKAKGGA